MIFPVLPSPRRESAGPAIPLNREISYVVVFDTHAHASVLEAAWFAERLVDLGMVFAEAGMNILLLLVKFDYCICIFGYGPESASRMFVNIVKAAKA